MFFCVIVGCILAAALIVAISELFSSNFTYPYFVCEFDVSGKRGVVEEDWLDHFLIDGGFEIIKKQQLKIEEWKEECERYLEHCWLKKYRKCQYLAALDDAHAFQFSFIRAQTRYRQVNYIKSPYTVMHQSNRLEISYDEIKRRYEELAVIGFECTLHEYNSKNQRKLATRQLREKIMRRDNYTCQICGKYMPDEVGLQIDHIVPISKNGKTVESNLRVLCSKCNGRKADKMPEFESRCKYV